MRRMVRDAVWLAGSALALRAASMLFQLYLASTLGAAGLGLWQLVLTAGGLAVTMALAGGKIAAMYLTARAIGADNEAGTCTAVSVCLCYVLCTGALVAVLLWFFVPWIAAHFVQEACASLSLRAWALLLPAAGLSAVMSGYAIARGKIRRQVLVDLLERAVSIGLTVFLLRRAEGVLRYALFALVVGGAAPPLLSFALHYGFYRRERRCVRAIPKRPVWKELLGISLPLALGDLLRAGLNTVEQFLIPWGLARSSSRYLALSAYGTIQGMAFPVLLFPASILYALSDLLVPELSRCTVQKDFLRVRSLTGRCFQRSALFAAAVAGVLYSAAGELGQLLYRSESAGWYLRLLSPMVLFLYLDAIVDGMLKGLGQQVYTVRYNTVTNVIDVVGLYTTLPAFGVAGYVAIYTVSHLVNFFLSLRRLLLVADALPSLRRQAALLVLVVLCGLLSSLIPANHLWTGLFLHTFAYLALFFLGGKALHLFPDRGSGGLRKNPSFMI